MEKPVVVIGIGELGGVFAKGFLHSGIPVVPVVRSTDLELIAVDVPDPSLVLVAVAETSIDEVLDTIPLVWKSRLGLLQNELIPQTWLARQISEPTVISVWFEKKKGMDVRVLQPSPVYGPHADLIIAALSTLSIPSTKLASYEELVQALIVKNVFVSTINIAGLLEDVSTGELWVHHRKLVLTIATDILTLQNIKTGMNFLPEEIIVELEKGLLSDPEHRCKGRVAEARLERTLNLAQELGVTVPILSEVAESRKIMNN